MTRSLLLAAAAFVLAAPAAHAQQPPARGKPARAPWLWFDSTAAKPGKPQPTFRWLRVALPAAKAAADKLPLCGLPPAKLLPGLCAVRYRISTASPECQAYFDQGLGYFYSYVWLEAARSFETAARHDPNCPMVWWA